MKNKKGIKEALERLITQNNENFENIDLYDDKSYAKGYTEGVHDGLLGAMKVLGIETEEEYFN